ncbi:hypothetical protein GGE45_001263 [Rhizobium aethiopicum]|uniref:Uncharacterized protein n=2 Tax=Rhizobium TaxID=379 RepID=A0A7W6MG01_9HYPH|nr:MULTISPECIES: hypothetical protein [Rhizobium]ARO26344.1 hypothetical protein TAL182_PA00155 [Rhizobium sp. TAL182]MBB4192008.1 hypothetical protein [Rhizobium aethiopicum]MBB4578943.1 hypothetical protein [Rhizobium aethiopicum]
MGKSNKSRTDPGQTGLVIIARPAVNIFQRPSLDSLASPDRPKSIENAAALIVPVQEGY